MDRVSVVNHVHDYHFCTIYRQTVLMVTKITSKSCCIVVTLAQSIDRSCGSYTAYLIDRLCNGVACPLAHSAHPSTFISVSNVSISTVFFGEWKYFHLYLKITVLQASCSHDHVTVLFFLQASCNHECHGAFFLASKSIFTYIWKSLFCKLVATMIVSRYFFFLASESIFTYIWKSLFCKLVATMIVSRYFFFLASESIFTYIWKSLFCKLVATMIVSQYFFFLMSESIFTYIRESLVAITTMSQYFCDEYFHLHLHLECIASWASYSLDHDSWWYVSDVGE